MVSMTSVATGPIWSIDNCKLIELPKIHAAEGNLTFVESHRHVPFSVRRVYYLYDVPGGATRGGHAHRQLWQLMIAMSGSFDVELDDGRRSKKVHLNRSYFGLLISPWIWRNLNNFSSGSVCMVLASEIYDEADYIRDYETFVSASQMESQ